MADLHYCDIFSDCYRCPVPYCPYEKLDDESYSGWANEDEEGESDEDDYESSDCQDGI